MPIRVTCPNCTSLLSAPRKLMGQIVKCPACKARCRVPQVQHLINDPVELTFAAQPMGSKSGGWFIPFLVGIAATTALSVGAFVLFKLPPESRPAFLRFGGNGPIAEIPEEGVPAEPGDGAIPLVNGQDVPVTAVNVPAGVDPLAAKAEAILKQRCYRCHGENGVAEGGFNYVLRADKLQEGGRYVAAGKPKDSLLLRRIIEGEMPPDDGAKLPDAEIAALTEWINSGAKGFALPPSLAFVDNAGMIRLIREDLESVDQRNRKFTRYFTLTNLANSGFSEEELQTYRLALAKLLNSLSWNRELAQLHAIDPAKTIFRLDLRDLNWDDKTWALIVKANPYSVVFDTPDSKTCLNLTDCEVPHVRADWFVAAASRPPLYHEVLQVPATVKELEKLLNVDVAANIKNERVARAGMNASGVSQHNRLIERHRSQHGALWVSYDFDGSTGRKNLNNHPLGPGEGADRFDHAGGEIIFNLPNGLQGYMLADAKGGRLDKAPTSIVSDNNRPDRAVVNGVSCMTCHYNGIIAKADSIRAHVEANRASFPEANDILALYPKQSELDGLYAEDAKRFTDAVNKLGMTQLTSTGEPVVNMAHRFEADLDLKAAAAELGLRPEEFTSKLATVPALGRVLGVLNVAGAVVKREVFIQQFAEAVTKFGLGTAVKAEERAPAEAVAVKPATTPSKVEPLTVNPNAPANGNLRVFTNAQTGKTLEAEFLGLSEGLAQLKTADGKTHSVALAELVAADQSFIQAKAAPPADLPPDETTPPGVAVADSGATPPGRRPGRPGRQLPPPKPSYRPLRPDRIFTNTYISTSVAGEFLTLRHGEVRIRRPNGIVVLWPLEHLSPPDHGYIAKEVGPQHYEEHKMPVGIDWQAGPGGQQAPNDQPGPPGDKPGPFPPRYQNVRRY